MKISIVIALLSSICIASLGYASNSITTGKIQTKEYIGACMSASFINESGKEGPATIIASKEPINPSFKYYCVKGKMINIPSQAPCSLYAKKAFKITSFKQINSPNDSCGDLK